jgi:AmmeMemoRadiSam system protein B
MRRLAVGLVAVIATLGFLAGATVVVAADLVPPTAWKDPACFGAADPLSSNSKGLGKPNPGIAISPTSGEIARCIHLSADHLAWRSAEALAPGSISPLVGEIAILGTWPFAKSQELLERGRGGPRPAHASINGRTAPACPPGDQNYPRFYSDSAQFEKAIASAAGFDPSNEKLSGVVVPHHLLAAHLIATGFKAASGFSYKRIVILTPDHFRRADKPFATTARGFDGEFGTVTTDRKAVAKLLAADISIEESCLFGRDHGIRALLPFVRHYFPDVPIVPVAIALRSSRADWDAMTEALQSIIDADTLVIESTDFSHYLPQHEARRFDQQTLNVIASGSLDQLARLRQPDHLDSLGALYVQTKLQREKFGAAPLVIANENAQQYGSAYVAETTSYMVILFGGLGTDYNDPSPQNAGITYFAGDTNFGRAMKHVLIRDGAEEKVIDAVLSRTMGRPLIVNLEGVILPNVPEAIDDLTLAMPEDLTIAWLKKLNVAAVGLANNHAFDLGLSGYQETIRALEAAGIRWFGQGEVLELPGLDVVGLSDLDTNAARQVDLLTPELLDRLIRPDASKATIAFVHWGREYVDQPSEREMMLAEEMRLRSVTAIIGAHPHVASGRLDALAGGDVLQHYSLGNFLFDQSAERASGNLLELRVFEQGTVFGRLIPLPNLFDLAKE